MRNCVAGTPVARHAASLRRPRGAGEVLAARIAIHVEQVEALRREQLDDVRRAHRTLIARAEPDVLDRRPVAAELVGVGLDARAVVGVAIRRVERQLLRARLALDQRNAWLP